MRRFSLLLFLCASLLAAGQKRANIWTFGDSSAINFNSPLSFLQSSSGFFETSSMCQKDSGSLLFYCDAKYIYGGDNSIIDSFPDDNFASLSIPMPGNDSLYYIFLVYNSYFGIKYTLFNTKLNSGNGGVQPGYNEVYLDSSSSIHEQITAVHHSNNCDVWIVVHNDTDDVFKSYLVTSSGILPPVISHAGVHFTGLEPALGIMKFSTDGNMLAMTINNRGVSGNPAVMLSGVAIFHFNNQTGIISDYLSDLAGPMPLTTGQYFHGVSFSCDNSKLYFSKNTGEIFQMDLLAGSISDIINSKAVINPGHITLQNAAALQLGPDHKIYAAQRINRAISVINEPENSGLACDYQDSIHLRTNFGLSFPQFIESYFYCPAVSNLTVDTIGCIGDTISFNVDSVFNASNYEWTFGDTSNSIFGTNVNHMYRTPGTYEANLIVHYNCNALIAGRKNITIYSNPTSQLGSDTIFCGSDSIRIQAGTDTSLFYHWSTGDSAAYTYVQAPGTYDVSISNGTCIILDSILINNLPYPGSILPSDSIVCGNDSILLIANSSTSFSYLWSTGDSTNSTYAIMPGIYSVSISDSLCHTYDTIVVNQIAYPISSLPADTIFCGNDSITLISSMATVLEYVWSTGDTTSNIVVADTGIYSVTIMDSTCLTVDSVHVHKELYPLLSLMPDTFQCGNSPVLLTAGPIGYSYLWSTGDTTNQIVVANPGTYFVSASSSICVTYDTILVNQKSIPQISLPNDSTICGSGPLVLKASQTNNNQTFFWSTGDTTNTINISEPGPYSVHVTDSFCSADKAILITQKQILPNPTNVVTPNGDGKNDVFFLGDSVLFRSLVIWNRWGTQIFESHDPNPEWDGKLNGQLLAEGTYYYAADYLDCDAKPTSIKGTIYLKQ